MPLASVTSTCRLSLSKAYGAWSGRSRRWSRSRCRWRRTGAAPCSASAARSPGRSPRAASPSAAGCCGRTRSRCVLPLASVIDDHVARRVVGAARRRRPARRSRRELVLLVVAELQHAAQRRRELRADRDLHLLQVGVVEILGDVADRVGDAPEQPGARVQRLRDVAVVVGQRDDVAFAVVGVALVIASPAARRHSAPAASRRRPRGAPRRSVYLVVRPFGVGHLGAVADDVVLRTASCASAPRSPTGRSSRSAGCCGRTPA